MCLALSCKSFLWFHAENHPPGSIAEFLDEVSKFPQIVCGRDQTQILVSCPCLGGAYHCIQAQWICHLSFSSSHLNYKRWKQLLCEKWPCVSESDKWQFEERPKLYPYPQMLAIAAGSPPGQAFLCPWITGHCVQSVDTQLKHGF